MCGSASSFQLKTSKLHPIAPKVSCYQLLRKAVKLKRKKWLPGLDSN
jgi:hypothetical protein